MAREVQRTEKSFLNSVEAEAAELTSLEAHLRVVHGYGGPSVESGLLDVSELGKGDWRPGRWGRRPFGILFGWGPLLSRWHATLAAGEPLVELLMVPGAGGNLPPEACGRVAPRLRAVAEGWQPAPEGRVGWRERALELAAAMELAARRGDLGLSISA